MHVLYNLFSENVFNSVFNLFFSRATNHTGEASSYKPQRPPAAPPSPAQFSNYPPAHPPNSMRYVQQQPPYGGAVPYRDNPYTVRTPVSILNI